MGSEIPKQFILIRDKPLLMYTIEQFYHFDPTIEIILTLPEAWKLHWEHLRSTYDFNIPHRVISGGEERFDSVKNALRYCQGDWVGIHDGVRPLIDKETIASCFDSAKKYNAVIPVLPVKESLREKTESGSRATDRSRFMLVQTPQCFNRTLIAAAYEAANGNHYTDDASVVEAFGESVTLVEGKYENIKITTPFDLRIAEYLLK